MHRSSTEVILLVLAAVFVLIGIGVIATGVLAQRNPTVGNSGIAAASWLFGGLLIALGLWSAVRAMR